MNRTDWYRPVDLVAWISALAVLATLPGHAAHAAATPQDRATWQAECGSCHVAFPPRMLDAAAWTKILGSLDRHYGVDASLDPTALASVRREAGVPAAQATPTVTGTLPRITTSPWFLSEHREVSTSTWHGKAVGRPANCGACHAGADRGNFEEESERNEHESSRNENRG